MARGRCLFLLCLINFCFVVTQGYERENRDVDACSGKTCLVNDLCQTGNTSFLQNTCVCLQGYMWADEENGDCLDIDECSNHFHDPCEHRGTCVNTVGSYRCQCLPGWEGDTRCATNVTGPNPPCMPGYHGDMCKDSMCGHNGYAEPTGKGNDFICICRPGWTNTAPDKPCDMDTNECLDNTTCQHGASCDNSPGHYHCQCSSDFDCIQKACSKNGSCVNNTCQCAPGWIGPDCSTKDCDPSCLNEGVCVNDVCQCSDEWSGPSCATKACSSPCRNGGECVNGICHCDRSWKGTGCTTKNAKNSATILYPAIGGGFVALALISVLVALLIRHKVRLRKVKDGNLPTKEHEVPQTNQRQPT